ncbi:MFS transporter [Lactococcus formosensis]|jgi:MFS family permease|uniref:MFS transporter n=1 Tax=Lactococcus formosensis TaxID=1281486 RepID=A0A9Q8Y284_9LACT|nr:MFS transporter [Lactococcus formosensis]MCH1722558.1 MFS transporter [Lactococcus formosensis]MDG6113241.1 MFS transporter [Lactococcus formosensis]MDG6114750.1 MFS transporter [Lactococcus formosensis]MDG6118896.1 MFS transporter [Lactococcus formosensis]MDG6120900.1 MFS transporter [Lactococcus formosensis]
MRTHTSAQSKAVSAYQVKVGTLVSAGFGLENMDIMFLSFALSSIIGEFGLTTTEAGAISTVTNLGMLLGGILFGILADKFGRVKMLSLSILIFGLATGAIYFSHSVTSLYILRFIAGIGGGGEYGVGMTILAENFSKKKLGRTSSIVAVAGQVGAMCAAILSMSILPTYGWRFLFLFGLVPVVLTVFIQKHLKESDSFKAIKTENKGKISDLFKTRQLTHQTLVLMWMAIVQIAGYFGLMNWLPTIMQQKLNLTVAGSSSWMIATIIGMSLGMLTFGQILDKLGPKVAFGLFLIASSLAVYVLTIPTTLASLTLVGAVVGYFSNGMFTGYGAVVSRLYPPEVRATANNVIMNTGRCIGGFSSIVIGFILAHYSIMTVMLFISVLYILSFLAMLTVKNLRANVYWSL